jgi:hypothetical protein
MTTLRMHILWMIVSVLPAGMIFAASPVASISILAVSPFGELLQPVTVTRFAADSGRGDDYSARFAAAKADGVPYGDYLAQIRAGGRTIASVVKVRREKTLLVLSGPSEFIDSGPARGPGVGGRVSGVGGVKPVWVRMVRVFSEDICCTILPLSDDGTFSFGGIDAADYVLLVLTDGQVLFEGRIRIDSPNAMINVDLVKNQATVVNR